MKRLLFSAALMCSISITSQAKDSNRGIFQAPAVNGVGNWGFPEEGDIVYDLSNNTFNGYNGTGWDNLSAASSPAGSSTSGIVTHGPAAQNFGGPKTFDDNVTVSGTLTPSGGIAGDVSGVSVAAGKVGELVRVSRGRSVSNTLASGVDNSVTATTLDLTPGIWLVSGAVGIAGSATSARLDFGLNTTTSIPAATSIPHLRSFSAVTTNLSLGDLPGYIPPYYLVVTSNTSYYLVCNSTFSGGSAAAYGYMQAVRIN